MAANPLNERKRCLYIFMRINSLLQPNLTGELIKFRFLKTTMTFRSLKPVLTLLARVNNNDMGGRGEGGIVTLCPLDTSSQMKMCFDIFTQDNPSKHSRERAHACMKISQQMLLIIILILITQQVPLSKAKQINGDATIF